MAMGFTRTRKEKEFQSQHFAGGRDHVALTSLARHVRRFAGAPFSRRRRALFECNFISSPVWCCRFSEELSRLRQGMGALTGKVVVVTGASRGIGRATVERLAKDGASVVVNYATSAEEADAVVEVIRTRGGEALAIQADIARLEDIRRLFRETMERLERLYILVANAGYSCFKPMDEITEEDFDLTYRLNAKGTTSVFKRRCATWSMAAGSYVSRR